MRKTTPSPELRALNAKSYSGSQIKRMTLGRELKSLNAKNNDSGS